MAYKNAEINSEKEAINRLMDGEVFYYQDKPIIYDLDRYVVAVAFTCDGDPLDRSTLLNFKNWEVFDWTTNLPLLCKVWDVKDNPTEAVVTSFNGWMYFTSCDQTYFYAKPLTKEEVQLYLDKAPK
jgi:hypothetical protein